jgi:hypothetical protein
MTPDHPAPALNRRGTRGRRAAGAEGAVADEDDAYVAGKASRPPGLRPARREWTGQPRPVLYVGHQHRPVGTSSRGQVTFTRLNQTITVHQRTPTLSLVRSVETCIFFCPP